jgi:glycine/serine hydroxymethyltransferase
MGLPEMSQIADLIARAIKEGEDDAKANSIRQEVYELTAKFPVYPR